MRLIDTQPLTDWIINELRWALSQKKGAFDSMTGRQAANVIGKKIDDAPTIDAIPVEWLREKNAWVCLHAAIHGAVGGGESDADVGGRTEGEIVDFVQVMKDWRRMCMAMEKLHPNDACAGCRLEGYGCPAIYEDNSHVDYSDVERKVTAWAAEHPEPVYPTWYEFLVERYHKAWEAIGCDSIPADIAEKLGIEPKEG